MDEVGDAEAKAPDSIQDTNPEGILDPAANGIDDTKSVEEATDKNTAKEQTENEETQTLQEESGKAKEAQDLQTDSKENGVKPVDPTPSNHVRTTSKVEVIEAPSRPVSSYTSSMIRSSSSNAPPALQPEDMQHRHDHRKDQASSYQPTPPKSYMQLRAVALQLPNSIASTSSASHVDPPTIIMEARTNLSSARRSFYPKVTRTLPELHLWLLALTLSFPASIFSPFEYPPPTLINGGTSTDSALRDYLVTITNQLGRIMKKQYVLSHPATVALVDCDFSYTPSLPHVGPGSSPLARRRMEEGLRIARSGFDPLRGKRGKGGSNGAMSTWDVDGVAAALGLPTSVFAGSNDATTAAPSTSINPLSLFSRANASPQRIQVAPPVALPPGEEDEDEEDLTLARNEITRLEMQFEKASQSAQMVLEKSGALSATLNQLTQALANLDRLDAGRVISKRSHEEEINKIMIRGIEAWSAAEAGASSTMVSTITPSLAYQSFNARMAIDALLRRAAAATHRHSALVVLVQKRREAERLKRARGEIRQEEVDWVLSELKDAQRTTNLLTHHLATFTSTLKDELKSHSKYTHNDVQSTLLGHARNSIRAHRFLLNNLKKARDELLAKREGKTVQEIGESSSFAVNSQIASLVPTVKEEQPVQKVEQEREANRAEAKTHPDIVKPGTTKAEEREEAATTTLTASEPAPSRDKALPTAPADDESKAEQDHISTFETEGTAQEEQMQTETPAKPLEVEAQEAVPPLFTPSNDTTSISNPSITQSGFLPPTSSPQTNGDPSKMSQSAFLPARNMDRYANPFARLDPSLTATTTPAAPTTINNSNTNNNGKAKVNDVWANRSRLSASDAARSLAGRF
jgi:hypothetical protein